MPRALWIAFYREIRDAEKLKAYAEIAGPTIREAGGVFLARGMPAFVCEAGVNERTVVIEFPSLESARRCYESAAYKAALDALGDGAVRDMRFVETVS